MRFLLKEGGSPNAGYAKNGTREDALPLSLAAKWGHLNVVQELLKNGAEVDAISDGGRTALHAAAATSREHVVKFLVDKGADVTIKGDDGKTAQEIAEGNQALNIVRILKSSKGKQTKKTTKHIGAKEVAKDKDDTNAPVAAAALPVLIQLDGATLHAGSLDNRKPAVIKNLAKMADGSVWPAFETWKTKTAFDKLYGKYDVSMRKALSVNLDAVTTQTMLLERNQADASDVCSLQASADPSWIPLKTYTKNMGKVRAVDSNIYSKDLRGWRDLYKECAVAARTSV